jgi:hypothetical protein
MVKAAHPASLQGNIAMVLLRKRGGFMMQRIQQETICDRVRVKTRQGGEK